MNGDLQLSRGCGVDILGEGSGKSKKEAEQAAARDALRKIKVA